MNFDDCADYGNNRVLVAFGSIFGSDVPAIHVLEVLEMSEELKNCPFCGGEADVMLSQSRWGSRTRYITT